MKVYNNRCDNSILKQAYLKDGLINKNNIMSNLQKKFNIDDQMMSPFTKMKFDTGFVLDDILNMEKTNRQKLSE